MLLSLLLHLLLFVSLEAGRKAGLWRENPLRVLAESALLLPSQSQAAKPPPPQPRNQEPPLLFVDVDPAQAVAEPPKEAKYYSSQSTVAANPDTSANTDAPKITGKQTQVTKTFDTKRAEPQPERPAQQPVEPPAPKPEPKVVQTAKAETLTAESKPQPQVKAEPKPEPQKEKPVDEPVVEKQPGDLALGKPAPRPKFDTTPAASKAAADSSSERPRERIRKLAAVKQSRGEIIGETMQQEGGVKRWNAESTLDVRSTTFGAYDAAIIAAIQQRWYDLLEQRKFAAERSGKVVLEFHLTSDGKITNMNIVDCDVGDFWGIICQKAVEDPAPYGPWNTEMKRQIGRSYREVRFTFYYN